MVWALLNYSLSHTDSMKLAYQSKHYPGLRLLPNLGAGSHCARYEGSLMLSHLLREKTGQGREMNASKKRKENRAIRIQHKTHSSHSRSNSSNT